MALLLAACSADGDGTLQRPADENADRGAMRQDAAERPEPAIRTAPDDKLPGTVIASPDPDVAGSAAGNDSEEAKAAENGWLADPPTLLGIAIGSRETAVRETLGKPVDEYGIADPEPLTILEYDGYSTGIGVNDSRVRFVEVHDPDVPTGLGELAVGDAADDAREALGEPDSASALVLRYVKDDLTLKLDLDPKTKTIAVIRLFGE